MKSGRIGEEEEVSNDVLAACSRRKGALEERAGHTDIALSACLGLS